MPERHFVWDLAVRLFHWSLVAAFAANALFTASGKTMHRRVGYVVLGLLALRLVWGFIGSRHARFADFPPAPGAAIAELRDLAAGRHRLHLGHSPLGALMIYNLLVTLVAIGATGYMMTTLPFFGMDWVEELHGAFVTWAELSIVAHVAAVIWQSHRLGVNLPHAMVTGYKVVPEGRSGV